jgi:hypothetical protein
LLFVLRCLRSVPLLTFGTGGWFERNLLTPKFGDNQEANTRWCMKKDICLVFLHFTAFATVLLYRSAILDIF